MNQGMQLNGELGSPCRRCGAEWRTQTEREPLPIFKSVSAEANISSSTFTALRVTTSADLTNSGCLARSWVRTASTDVRDKPRCRTDSRRNAAFLCLDSTITMEIVGTTTFIGIAGEPPPEPMSMTDARDLADIAQPPQARPRDGRWLRRCSPTQTGKSAQRADSIFAGARNMPPAPQKRLPASSKSASAARLASFSRNCTQSGYFKSRPTYDDRTARAAGVIPGMRIAWPNVAGRT